MMRNLYRKVWLPVCFMFIAAAVFAQERVVSGSVTDENGAAIPGVNVLQKGTSNGTATDASGNFRITVPNEQAILVFSFVGYATAEEAVGNRSSVSIKMTPDVQTLSELVVVGYGSQQKKDITGSVAIVDVKDMTKIASSNFADQLQGKIAGVQMSTSGDPGAAQFVRIRGIGTINNNEPLYVIDGVPVVNEANMNFLNPNDIESMQVLKDASAAAIYGSRAANGVIVITTRKGKGTSKITFDYFYGSQVPAKTPDVASPTELLQILQGLQAGSGNAFASNFYVNNNGTWQLPDFFTRSGGFVAGAPEVDPSRYNLITDPNGDAGQNYLIARANKGGTNWFNEVFKPASLASYQLTASGGSEKGNYYLSANYYDNNGILLKNFYKRAQVRMNSTYNIKNTVRVGENFNIAYQTTQAAQGNPSEGSALKNTYSMPQIVPVYDINGYFASPAALPSNSGHPVAQQIRAAENKGHTFRITGNVFAEFDFLKYFTFKSSFGVDYNSGPTQLFGFRNFEATEINASNSLEQRYFLERNWVYFNTLTFNREFGDNKINVLAGTEARENYYEGFNAGGNKLAIDDPSYRVLSNITDNKTYFIGSYRGNNRLSSLFAQANYSFKDKYLITGTVRRDGSSRFLNNKYGVFPSGSFGWRISREDFMQGISAINELKLRTSYGATGNNETVGNNRDFSGYNFFNPSIGNSSYDITGSSGSVRPGFDQTATGNPDLKWETTYLFNVGFDATLFNNFDLTVEYYTKNTKDMIYGVELPLEQGAVGVKNINVGDMKNSGLELSLTYRNKALGNDLNYSIGLTGTTIRNEVTRLDANSNTFIRSGGTRIGDVTYTTAGQPISQFYGYIADGLWTSDSEINTTLFTAPGDAKVGRVKFRDLNGDGQIDTKDETFIGNPLPKFILGLNLTANYKNFDFTLFVNGSYGNKIFNFMKYFTDFPAFQGNYSKRMLYEAGKSLPVLDKNDNYSPQRSTLYVEDGSFTRIRNLQIGYSLPAATLSKFGIDKFRIYVQGQNLFTITNYSGLDPDVTVSNITEGFTARRDLSMGVDYGRYPWARTYIVGVNIGF